MTAKIENPQIIQEFFKDVYKRFTYSCFTILYYNNACVDVSCIQL